MGMILQHNLTSINANRILGVTTRNQIKSVEKISSGSRINRAADDAAGLSISEKMRKQIHGLSQASTNAQDGISTIQTAEGALDEIQGMLQRMNELAVKSANGTLSESDRTAIQDEVDQLISEINRVSETTKFNETYLLRGSNNTPRQYSYCYNNYANMQNPKANIKNITGIGSDYISFSFIPGSIKTQTTQDETNNLLKSLRDSGIKASAESVWNKSLALPEAQTVFTLELTGDAALIYNVSETASAGIFSISDNDGNELAKISMQANISTQATEKIRGGKIAGSTRAVVTAKGGKAITAAQYKSASVKYYDKNGKVIPESSLDNIFNTSFNGNMVVRSDAPTVYDAVGYETTPNVNDIYKLSDNATTLLISLHAGADSSLDNKIFLNIDPISVKRLGINGIKVDGSDGKNATNALDVISDALNKVSSQRSSLGAIQNKLEHAIRNLDTTIENTTSAESSIRDTDMASEMVAYSQRTILTKAGQSVLAQANQTNQGVLFLLS